MSLSGQSGAKWSQVPRGVVSVKSDGGEVWGSWREEAVKMKCVCVLRPVLIKMPGIMCAAALT